MTRLRVTLPLPGILHLIPHGRMGIGADESTSAYDRRETFHQVEAIQAQQHVCLGLLGAAREAHDLCQQRPREQTGKV
jgi:hypothetical protein